MRLKSSAIIGAVAVLACIGVSQIPPTVAFAQKTSAKLHPEWEYDVVTCDTANPLFIPIELDKKGSSGWEVCGTLSESGKPSVILLKRPKLTR